VRSYEEIPVRRITKRMKIIKATIVGNSKEDPASGPDQDPNTWLLEAKLEVRIPDWEIVQLDLRSSEIKAEVVEKQYVKAKSPDYSYPREITSAKERFHPC
jgi:hypothetical protein